MLSCHQYYNVYEFVPKILTGVRILHSACDHSLTIEFDIRNWSKVGGVQELNKMVFDTDEFKFLFGDKGGKGGCKGNIQTYRNSYDYLVVRYVKRKDVPHGAICKSIKFSPLSYQTLKKPIAKMMTELDDVLPCIKNPSVTILEDMGMMTRYIRAHLNDYYYADEVLNDCGQSELVEIFQKYLKGNGMEAINHSLASKNHPIIPRSLFDYLIDTVGKDGFVKTVTDEQYCDPGVSCLLTMSSD